MGSLTSNPYLDEFSAKIRAKNVPWEAYQRADLVTAEELALIKKVDRLPRARTENLLLSDGPTYALLYLKLLNKLNRIDTIQCLLVLIADALIDHEERIPLFLNTAGSDPELPYTPLLRALDSQDEFTQLKSAQILTLILSSYSTPLSPQHLQPYLTALAGFIQSTTSANKRDVAVQSLESILARAECRRPVWSIPGITAGLVQILKHKPGSQMSYQVAFCLWLLSFDKSVAEQMNEKFDVIPLLTDVAQAAVKEKVIRVIVATFRNLVEKAPTPNLPVMLVCQLLPFVKNLATRKFQDEDIPADVEFLRDELARRFESMSTYDEYKAELASGRLSWTSPVHESDDFWKENASKLNEGGDKQLKVLVHLLESATDPTVLAVAVHDVGQYVKHCDRGKKVATDLGAKARVMDLMTHEDADVRYRALVSVQALVSQPWVGA